MKFGDRPLSYLKIKLFQLNINKIYIDFFKLTICQDFQFKRMEVF